MAKELKVVSYVKGKDGERIPLDSLSDEQRSEYAAKIRESVANSISLVTTNCEKSAEPIVVKKFL